MKTNFKTFVSASIFIALLMFCAASVVVVYRTAIGGISKTFSSRMAGVGIVSSALADANELNDILSLKEDSVKTSPLYLKYHTPLEKIARETDSTFVYLFKYAGSKDLTYIVDATSLDNPEWAPPGEEENSVDDDLSLGLLHSYRGVGGASDIVDTKEWGLMMTGTYPMCEKGERSQYMTGVDVAIGEILERTALVFTKLGVVFLLISAMAIFAAAMFSRILSRRVAYVKGRILKIGAEGSVAKLAENTSKNEVAALEEIISDYALKSELAIDKMEKLRGDMSLSTSICRMREAIKSGGDGRFEFTSLGATSDGSEHFAARAGAYVYAFSLKNSDGECAMLLSALSIISRLSKNADNNELSELCASFYKFDAQSGDAVFASGSQAKCLIEARNGLWFACISFADKAEIYGRELPKK